MKEFKYKSLPRNQRGKASNRKNNSGSSTKRLLIIDNKQALILKLCYNKLKIILTISLKTKESLKRSKVNYRQYDISIIWVFSKTCKTISRSFCENRF